MQKFREYNGKKYCNDGFHMTKPEGKILKFLNSEKKVLLNSSEIRTCTHCKKKKTFLAKHKIVIALKLLEENRLLVRLNNKILFDHWVKDNESIILDSVELNFLELRAKISPKDSVIVNSNNFVKKIYAWSDKKDFSYWDILYDNLINLKNA